MTAIEFSTRIVQFKENLTLFAESLTSDKVDAQDLYQETIFKALKYRQKFTAETNIKAWLYTIMKNTFINDYRRKKRANTFMDKSKDAYYLNAVSSKGSISPESSYSHGEIIDALENLEDDLRIPFTRHIEGYKYKEIADEMGLPIGTIKSRIFNARKVLAVELADFNK